MNLTLFQKKLCNALQNGLPTVERPFAEIARILDSDEIAVLADTKKLIELGVIRRISAAIDYRVLGRISTLVAAHVEEPELPSVAAAVSRLESVSHNYLRDHFYNLWFTLQCDSEDYIALILAKLATDTRVEFHSLPALRIFKLDVRFDAESDGKFLLPCEGKSLTTENTEIAEASLSKEEKSILSKLQRPLEIVSEPFSFANDSLYIIQNIVGKGVIRRIAAVVDYHKLGFAANAMFACSVKEERIMEAGQRLAASNNVSHCYHRSPFPGWPHNLFAMMHGRDMEQIEKVAANFVLAEKIGQSAILKTLQEFKKKPVNI